MSMANKVLYLDDVISRLQHVLPMKKATWKKLCWKARTKKMLRLPSCFVGNRSVLRFLAVEPVKQMDF